MSEGKGWTRYKAGKWVVRYMCVEEYVWRGSAGIESMVCGKMAIFWICVWRCVRWCYPKKANKCGARGVAKKGCDVER